MLSTAKISTKEKIIDNLIHSRSKENFTKSDVQEFDNTIRNFVARKQIVSFVR